MASFNIDKLPNGDFDVISQTVHLMHTQIIDNVNEQTKQELVTYLQHRYPNKYIEINLIDRKVAEEIIELGINEYIRIKGE